MRLRWYPSAEVISLKSVLAGSHPKESVCPEHHADHNMPGPLKEIAVHFAIDLRATFMATDIIAAVSAAEPP